MAPRPHHTKASKEPGSWNTSPGAQSQVGAPNRDRDLQSLHQEDTFCMKIYQEGVNGSAEEHQVRGYPHPTTEGCALGKINQKVAKVPPSAGRSTESGRLVLPHGSPCGAKAFCITPLGKRGSGHGEGTGFLELLIKHTNGDA